MNFLEQLNQSIELIEMMKSNHGLIKNINKAVELILDTINSEKPLLVCGNGGSASDAEHITGELVGRFLKERKAINAIALSSNSAALTAWSNDYDYESVFARQVEAHGKRGGLLWGISTSGNSKNVLKAIGMAKNLNLPIIGLTGKGGGKMNGLCDILLDVPSNHTPRVQEMHIMIYHYICEEVEKNYKQVT
jgi:D-sedoheptulose 7-phosphate isomerase